MSRQLRRLSAVLSVALGAATLSVVGVSGGAAGAPPDAAAAAVQRLQTDADGGVELVRDQAGVVTFVGTDAGEPVDNPAVSPSTSVSAAARAHLDRYAAALGGTRPGTSLREHRVMSTPGGDVVRFAQDVDGVPVLGGDVVVTLSPDGELVSMLSTMSATMKVPAATVTPEQAAQAARVVVGGDGPVSVGRGSRWLLDPGVVGTPSRLGARGVWRFTVSGQGLDRDVFVDDRTGSVLLVIDNHQSVQRVVCDNANATLNPNAADVPCVSPYARTETSGASAVADVNDVFTFVGATSDLFQSVGVDLTAMIGKSVPSVPGGLAIASTVRLCYTGANGCPYENAFWNGTEMYYGTGLTVDDITGHELTHGVTDRTSELLYWGQSGAINESMSDIFGEIVDHRTATTGDATTNFQLGEQSSLSAIRDLANPPSFSDPDSTQSTLYFRDLGGGYFYNDNGGVHKNSGVGNKTAYLIMKGGSLNGQTVTGLDAANDTFPKTAKLYMTALPSLASGADYADLGNVLNQSCQVLVATSGSGFTAADCVEVDKATLATQLALTPANAPQPADAAADCPVGTTKVVLFDSETGTPASKLSSTAPNWLRTDDPYWGSNAHSGQDSWNNATPIATGSMTAHTESLVTTSPVAVPAVGKTYLHFNSWYSLHFSISQPSGSYVNFFDGATVEVDDAGDAAPPVDVAAQPWVNGPDRVIASGSGNPAAGRTGFGGDSFGWTASRLDLQAFAGKSINPQFSVNFNNATTYIGWFVDDITVYNCAPLPVSPPVTPTQPAVVAGTVTVTGTATVGKKLTAVAGAWGPAPVTLTYQWLRKGAPIAGATGSTYKLTNKDKGKKVSVRVTGSKAGYTAATATSPETKKVKKKKKKKT